MSSPYSAIPGDHLARIAHQHGIFPYWPVWDEPANRTLRLARKTPHILAPRDPVVIPDRMTREVERVTEQRHRFRLHARPLMVRLALSRWERAPAGGLPYTLEIDGQRFAGTTRPDGTLEHRITPTAEKGVLTVEERTIEVYVGHLEPLDTLPGWRERLNNLGYDAGRSDDPDDLQLRSAVEEFQCDHGLQVDGVCGPGTQARLRQVHGC